MDKYDAFDETREQKKLIISYNAQILESCVSYLTGSALQTALEILIDRELPIETKVRMAVLIKHKVVYKDDMREVLFFTSILQGRIHPVILDIIENDFKKRLR